MGLVQRCRGFFEQMTQDRFLRSDRSQVLERVRDSIAPPNDSPMPPEMEMHPSPSTSTSSPLLDHPSTSRLSLPEVRSPPRASCPVQPILDDHQSADPFPDLGNDMDTRLITIEPSNDDSARISCTSRAVALRDELLYDALSYAWGFDIPSETITINGNNLVVGEALIEALVALRRRRVRHVWVDRLSIDQSNPREKDRQIAKMHIIYSHANKVYAWLGARYPRTLNGSHSPEGDGEMGLKLLSGEGPLPELDPFCLQAIQSILVRPYWKRCWIIQELCRGKHPFLLCGEDGITPFDVFWKNLDDFVRNTGMQWTGENETEHFNSLHTFHDQESIKSRRAQMSLIDALLLSRFSHASLGRDKIFALLNLSHDGSKLMDAPNYSQSDHTIYWKLAHNMIHLQGHIAIILLARRSSDRVPPQSPACEQCESSTGQSALTSRPVLEYMTSAPRQTLPHRNTSSLSSRDLALVVNSGMLKTLPSWVPYWAQLDDPLPWWLQQAVRHGAGSENDHIADYTQTTLCLTGWYLETVVSVSGIHGVIAYGTPEPNGLQTGRGATMLTTPHLNSPRRSTTTVDKDLDAVEVLRWVWRALLAPHCADEGIEISPFDHECHHVGCVGQKKPGYAIAMALYNARDPDVRKWWAINRTFVLGRKTLSGWIDDLAVWSGAQLRHENPRLHRQGRRTSRDPFCNRTTETELLSKAIRLLSQNKMRLALTSRSNVKVVYCETQPGDHICRLKGCILPVVLRPRNRGGFLEAELALMEEPGEIAPGETFSVSSATGRDNLVAVTSPELTGRTRLRPRIITTTPVVTAGEAAAHVAAVPTSSIAGSVTDGTTAPPLNIPHINGPATHLAQDSPIGAPESRASEYQFIGEVFLNTAQGVDSAFRNNDMTSWKPKHFGKDKEREFRIV